VSVCFERGGKIASSRTQKMQLKSDGTVEIIFEEALSLVVTMYREDSGKYQVQTSSLSSFFFCSFVGRKKLVTL
jgi:deoxycytidine triphosphate deaminase